MALVALVYSRSPGSEIALAKLISFTVIPVFIIGPIAGAWVDRLDRKAVMVICDLIRGVLVLLIPLFIFMNQILLVYLVIFIAFSLSRFFIPSKMAMIPDIVSKDKLLMANTLQDTTHMIGNVVGLVVAGVLVNIKHIGAIGGFYIDGATFFVSALLVGMIAQSRIIREVREDLIITKAALKDSIRKTIFADIKEGLNYFGRFKETRFAASVFFVLMAGLGAISCVIIVFIQNAFKTSTRDLGFLGMFLTGGLFSGILLYGRLGQRLNKKTMISLSFIASGILVILFTASVNAHPGLLSAGILVWLIGMAVSPITVSANTITQEMVPEEIRGRVFSSLEAVMHLGFLVFMFVAAYAAKYFDRSWILVMTGLLFCVFGIVGLINRKR